ncbi:hypothetical protein A7975_07830 [Bacillus sp. FJAT-26390]|nr:hypothetical protein A7975_07830 [Bacillus sp. FJAT-26390]
MWTSTTCKFAAPPDKIVLRLFVHGLKVRAFIWDPYEADITPFLRSGEKLIEIEMVAVAAICVFGLNRAVFRK